MNIREVYKFCPRCAQKLTNKNNHLHCGSCGLEFYTNPKPVQSAILKNDKGEYLFVIRAVEPRKGFLDFPGGFVDENEDFEQGVRRELKEELGVEVTDLKYLSTHTDEYLYQGITYKTVGVTFVGLMPSDAELKPADDVEDFVFYKLEDIPKDRLAFPSMHKMVKKLSELELQESG